MLPNLSGCVLPCNEQLVRRRRESDVAWPYMGGTVFKKDFVDFFDGPKYLMQLLETQINVKALGADKYDEYNSLKITKLDLQPTSSSPNEIGVEIDLSNLKKFIEAYRNIHSGPDPINDAHSAPEPTKKAHSAPDSTTQETWSEWGKRWVQRVADKVQEKVIEQIDDTYTLKAFANFKVANTCNAATLSIDLKRDVKQDSYLAWILSKVIIPHVFPMEILDKEHWLFTGAKQ